jgi:3-hydroxyacyl-CoA dehydrogenase
MELKRSVVQQLDGLSHIDTIIASNSSSFTIQQIIDGPELKHPNRCVSLHSCEFVFLLSTNIHTLVCRAFPNACADWPPETAAIEVMGTNITKPDIIPRLMKQCREHGFNPFHVKKSSSGYIYNR